MLNKLSNNWKFLLGIFLIFMGLRAFGGRHFRHEYRGHSGFHAEYRDGEVFEFSADVPPIPDAPPVPPSFDSERGHFEGHFEGHHGRHGRHGGHHGIFGLFGLLLRLALIAIVAKIAIQVYRNRVPREKSPEEDIKIL